MRRPRPCPECIGGTMFYTWAPRKEGGPYYDCINCGKHVELLSLAPARGRRLPNLQGGTH